MLHVYNEQMNQKTMLFAIIGGILLAVALGAAIITRPSKETKTVIDAVELIPYLQDGDIILRLGDGPLSPTFRNLSVTDKRFSHLGIVRIRDEEISIINSVGSMTNKTKGVYAVSLEQFLQVAQKVGVFRAHDIDGNMISDKALDYIDRPFDWNFDLNDDGKIYCTELLYAILKFYNCEHSIKTHYVKQIDKEIVPVDSISNSSAFTEILYIALKK